MKKLLLLVAIATLTFSIADAKLRNADEVKIYLNAGHGSWGPNDRPCATIPYPMLSTGRPDTCGFYESNTDLWKVLYMGEKLEELGVQHDHIMYSRVKNGPYPYVAGAEDVAKYNRNLAEISGEVEAFNGDMFISVHSNATSSDGQLVNYPVYLYRGYTGTPSVTGSDTIASTFWPYGWKNDIDVWSYDYSNKPYIVGDISFYGSYSTVTNRYSGIGYKGYLGVLKHGTPGMLIEGFFHTYQPARHRALNSDYCHAEGLRYVRGIIDYFGMERDKKGYIAGTVKDLHEKIDNPLYYYNPGSDDQWLPVNGATVSLYKGGVKVDEYTVDQNYNGVFVFYNLEPGDDYTLDATAPGYKNLSEFYKYNISVKANETTFPKIYMENKNYVAPDVEYKDYMDPDQPDYQELPDTIALKQEFVDKTIDVLAGKTVKRAIVRNGSLFVLAHDDAQAPYLYMINPEKQTLIKQLSIAGVTGGQVALNDICFTADGYLLGCNKDADTLKIYRWEEDYQTYMPVGDPELWITQTNLGGLTAGYTIASTRIASDAQIAVGAVNADGVVGAAITNVQGGQVIGQCTTVGWGIVDYMKISDFGDDFKFTVSPCAASIPTATRFVIDGKNTKPYEIEFYPSPDGGVYYTISPMGTIAVGDVAPAGSSFFRYDKQSLAALPAVDADGNITGAMLAKVTDGMEKAVEVKTSGTTIAAEKASTLGMGSKVEDNELSIYLLRGDKISKFTTESVTQPVVKGIYAYSLKAEGNDDKSYTFTFTANEEPTTAALVFTDATSGELVGEYPVTAKKGLNTVNVPYASLPGNDGQKMNWAVRLEAKAIPTISLINKISSDFKYNHAYVAVDNSTESDYLGRVYVADFVSRSSTNNGLYAYDQKLNRLNSSAYTGGETFVYNYRIGTDGAGQIFMTDYMAAHAGILVVKPDALNEGYTQFYDGTKASSGVWSNADGVAMGGCTTSATALGGKLYAFTKSLKGDGSANVVAVYNTGETTGTWNAAPSQLISAGKAGFSATANAVPDAMGGVWVGQQRGTGKNAEDHPALGYFNADGELVYNSVVDTTYINGSANGAVAITRDSKTLAINNASSEVVFFDVNWTDGKPTLAYKYTLDVSDVADGSGNVNQMAFDYAGNLHVAGENLGVYSITNAENQNTVPAKKANMVIKGSSGIVEIGTTDSGKAIKVVEDGQIFIIKDGKKYTPAGQTVK